MQDERKLKPEQNKFVQASNKQLTLTFVLFYFEYLIDLSFLISHVLVGPTLHVLRVGPHVDQRGEYGLFSLTVDPTQ
jgi:hypothetical protein